MYDGEEDFDAGTMLGNFRTSKGTVSELLGSADITVLLTSTSSVGGIAYLNSVGWPVGMATKWAAETRYVFGHEVAHIFGADHNKEQLAYEERGPAHTYGVGYLIPGTSKTTILA